jgi:hypothetical protein
MKHSASMEMTIGVTGGLLSLTVGRSKDYIVHIWRKDFPQISWTLRPKLNRLALDNI